MDVLYPGKPDLYQLLMLLVRGVRPKHQLRKRGLSQANVRLEQHAIMSHTTAAGSKIQACAGVNVQVLPGLLLGWGSCKPRSP
jgi:hypothetical protein